MAPPSAVLLRSPSGLKTGSSETEEEPWEQGAGFFSQPRLDKATPIPSAYVPGPSVTSPSVLTESVKAFEVVQSRSSERQGLQELLAQQSHRTDRKMESLEGSTGQRTTFPQLFLPALREVFLRRRRLSTTHLLHVEAFTRSDQLRKYPLSYSIKS